MPIKNVAKTVVINSKNEILLLRRSQTDPHRPETWDFPGGGVDEGEDIFSTAIREGYEEAGLEIGKAALRLVYTATELQEDTRESVNRFLFVTRLATEQEVRLSYEHDAFRWVDVETALIDFPHRFYGAGLRYAVTNDLLAA